MKLKLITLISLIALSFQACKKDPVVKNNSNYLLFGTYYGFCHGPCVTIYKLENGKLYKNNTQEKLDDAIFYKGSFTQMAQPLYDSVMDLEKKIPEALLSHPEYRIGCPDCADGGGIYVEYSNNGTTKHWLIDTNDAMVPKELHPFIDEIWAKMELLK
jgi:hypothetical protein